MDEFDGSHVIYIDDSIISTVEKRRGGSYEKENFHTPLIRKIKRTNVRDDDCKDYEPNILSIGPYHYGNLATKDMQTMKYECLDHILKMNRNKKLEDYMKAIMEIENHARNCYGDEIEMDRHSFVKMLLLDACFIILTLHGAEGITPPMPDLPKKGIQMKTYESTGECTLDMNESEDVNHDKQINAVNEDDSYLTRIPDLELFASDILLSENQIPFFVITKIYEIAAGGNDKTSLLIESIAEFIEAMLRYNPKSIAKFDRPKEFHHLLHLCHMYFQPDKTTFETYNCLNREEGPLHRAIEYNKVGIRFKKRESCNDKSHSLLDLGFSDGTMEIPCLNVDHNTRCMFRNLIAFEQTCPHIGNNITAYVKFWSRFISMPEDAALLRKMGILVHQLNSDAEVCEIFTKLSEGVVFDHGVCYLDSVHSKMEAHYRSNTPGLVTQLGSIASNLHDHLSKVNSNFLGNFL